LEKKTAEQYGLKPVPYATIGSTSDISEATKHVNFPAILKTSRLGYDGKGQHVCHNEQDVIDAFNAVGHAECVLEQRIKLEAEVSVVLARRVDGQTAVFPAQAQARQLADGLNYVGVLAVEFFIDGDGNILFNEMAPRPHNSGHYTLDATVSSQFEQQLRALCHLPLGDTRLLSPVCMVNILGDLWEPAEPAWTHIFETEGAHLHLYGKSAARAGRKMGHINFLGDEPEKLEQIALNVHANLS